MLKILWKLDGAATNPQAVLSVGSTLSPHFPLVPSSPLHSLSFHCSSIARRDMETVATSEESVRDSLDDTMSKSCQGEMDEESNNKSTNDSMNASEIALEDWTAITGLRVKLYTEEEKEAFAKPFQLGWKREVVLRGTVTHSGRKISDVYYFLPEQKVKLRSYIETGLYVQRNPDCGLTSTNFTFARQPIYHPPEEIVRHAMQKGSNPNANLSFSSLPSSNSPGEMAHLKISSSTLNSTPSPSPNTSLNSTRGPKSSLPDLETDASGSLSTNLVAGRAKRKRVAPSRFDDEEYEEQSPFKKKGSGEKSKSTPNSTPSSKQTLRVVAATGKNSIIITTNQAKAEAVRQQAASELEHVAIKVEATVKKQQQKVQQQQQVQQQAPSTPQQTITQSSPSTSSSLASASLLVAPDGETSQNGISSDELRNHLLQAQAESSPSHKQHAEEESECASSAPSTVSTVTVTPSSATNSTSAITPVCQTTSKGSASVASVPPLKLPLIKPKAPSRPPSETKATSKASKKNGCNPTTLANGSLIPPCSMTCSGLQGKLPSILCSRCLCLFHPQCVPGGIHLNQTHQFVCPNCIQPTDQGVKISEENGHLPSPASVTVSNSSSSSLIASKAKLENRKSLLESRSSGQHSSPRHMAMHSSHKSVLQNHSNDLFKSNSNEFVKSRASLGESILTHRQKSQLLLLQQFQQQLGCKPLTPGHFKMNSLPVRHQHQQQQQPHQQQQPQQQQQQSHHQQQSQQRSSHVGKSQTRLPQNRVDPYEVSNSFKLAPIAPIAPIRVNSSQVASILDYEPRPNRYAEYLKKKKHALMRLLGLFDMLNERDDLLSNSGPQLAAHHPLSKKKFHRARADPTDQSPSVAAPSPSAGSSTKASSAKGNLDFINSTFESFDRNLTRLAESAPVNGNVASDLSVKKKAAMTALNRRFEEHLKEDLDVDPSVDLTKNCEEYMRFVSQLNLAKVDDSPALLADAISADSPPADCITQSACD